MPPVTANEPQHMAGLNPGDLFAFCDLPTGTTMILLSTEYVPNGLGENVVPLGIKFEGKSEILVEYYTLRFILSQFVLVVGERSNHPELVKFYKEWRDLINDLLDDADSNTPRGI